MIGGRIQERNGKTTLVVGLSHKDLEHLREHQPIPLKTDSHPFIPANIEILLFAGSTDASMRTRMVHIGVEIGSLKGLRKRSSK